jgi:arylsulfatase A-like enzyme
VVEEIDWSVGEILKTVEELGLAENTLVFFTSDNGPWLAFKQEGGSAGLLRDGKGATWEGGMREPAIAWWPGTVPAGRTTAAVATTMDLLPTAFHLAGVELPQDRVLDGQNMLPVLKGEVDQLHDEVVYYLRREIYAYRKGPWKAHFTTLTAYAGQKPVVHDPPLLFHLENDPSEKYDLAAEHPEVIAEIKAAMEAHRATVVEMPDHLAGKIGEEE